MDYSTIPGGSELALQSSPSDPRSLYAALAQVPSGRLVFEVRWYHFLLIHHVQTSGCKSSHAGSGRGNLDALRQEHLKRVRWYGLNH
jgi:hypothetical protein